jgi:CubicO group peptidase (beta-lactamase class C family)
VRRLLLACALACAASLHAAQPYFPPPGETWATRPPEEVGIDAAKLAAAVRFAQENEVAWPRDVRAQIEQDTANEPYPEVLGPVKPRGGQNGIVLRHGYIVAEWGETRRVDMSFSVAKSYLSTVAGLAVDRGLIRDVHEPVGALVRDGGFESAHNRPITWHMLLNQTSEWQGVLWDKPDMADRRRGYFRTLEAPGTFWEYNDVRVNRLALALLRVWRRPLPEVLKEHLMDPIGASDTWVWHGYYNSYVDLDGARVQSVSGGSHWGGGFWASTRDHARFGYLLLRRGEWNGRRLLSDRWIELATTPTDIAPFYGYLWWLASPTSPVFPRAPQGSFFALGSGGNMIWIDPVRDLVVVTRWLDIPKLDEFVRKVVDAVRAPAPDRN